MRRDYELFEASVQLITISHDTAAAVNGWLGTNPLPFPWLLDSERDVMKAYGVYNAFSYDALRMAHPTAILIDISGIVRFIYRCSHQWDVPSNATLLDAVRALT